MVVVIGDVASHQHPGTDIVSPVPIAQLPVAASGVVDSGRVLSSADGRIAPLFAPEDHGLKAWSFDPSLAGSSFISGTNGYLHVVLVEVRESMPITGVGWCVTTVGATPTSNQNRIGVYRLSDRALVAQTGDIGSQITGSPGTRATVLAAGATLAPGFYYVAFQFTASTRPAITCCSCLAAAWGRPLSSARSGVVNTAYTTALPSTLPALSAITATAAWAALY